MKSKSLGLAIGTIVTIALVAGLLSPNAYCGVRVGGDGIYWIDCTYHKKDKCELYEDDYSGTGVWDYISQAVPHRYYLAHINGDAGYYRIKCIHYISGNVTWYRVYLPEDTYVEQDVYPCADENSTGGDE